MTDERRYQEDEVREIFDLAAHEAEVGRPTIRGERGLTLSELQEVGLQAGMRPERIAEAALTVTARREIIPRGRFVGVPTSVGRTVALPRAPTDHEWEVLVTELRETFGAKGQMTSHGGVREWSNGNLHAFVEPTATGYRLRLATKKGNAMSLITGGAAGFAVGLALVALFTLEGLGRAAFVIPVLMAAAGGGVLAANVLRLPRWARRRENQMEYIAGRAIALLSEPAAE